jgi:hypothetical protein
MSSSYTSRTLCLVVVFQISTFVHSIVGIVVPCTHDANSVAHLSRLTTVSDRFMPNEAFCETMPFAPYRTLPLPHDPLTRFPAQSTRPWNGPLASNRARRCPLRRRLMVTQRPSGCLTATAGRQHGPATAHHAPREHGIAQARIRPVPSVNLLTIASLSFFRAPTLIPRERHRHRRTRVQVVRPRRLCRVARCTFV